MTELTKKGEFDDSLDSRRIIFYIDNPEEYKNIDCFYMGTDNLKEAFEKSCRIIWTDSVEEYVIQNHNRAISFRYHFTKENPLYLENLYSLRCRLIKISAKTFYVGQRVGCFQPYAQDQQDNLCVLEDIVYVE